MLPRKSNDVAFCQRVQYWDWSTIWSMLHSSRPITLKFSMLTISMMMILKNYITVFVLSAFIEKNCKSSKFHTKWQKKSGKRSRCWNYRETIVIKKWSDKNIQKLLESCSEKNNIWNEKGKYLTACGYVDRDGDMCEIRIYTWQMHTLILVDQK